MSNVLTPTQLVILDIIQSKNMRHVGNTKYSKTLADHSVLSTVLTNDKVITTIQEPHELEREIESKSHAEYIQMNREYARQMVDQMVQMDVIDHFTYLDLVNKHKLA